jgi:predicted transcriptional regulator
LKKLKEFGKYEDWKSAQYMRAIQQAKLHGETVDIETLQKNDQQLEKKPRKKQNKKDIILEIIQKNNNKCHIDTIYDKTNEMGYVPEDIKKIIDHMEQEGLIYSPKPKTKSIV